MPSQSTHATHNLRMFILVHKDIFHHSFCRQGHSTQDHLLVNQRLPPLYLFPSTLVSYSKHASYHSLLAALTVSATHISTHVGAAQGAAAETNNTVALSISGGL